MRVRLIAGFVLVAALMSVGGAGPSAQEPGSGIKDLPLKALMNREPVLTGSSSTATNHPNSEAYPIATLSIQAEAATGKVVVATRGSVAHASKVEAGQHADPGTDSEPEHGVQVKLSTAERIRLRVPGFGELSGEYAVGADDAISIAGIGRIALGDQSPRQFERTLARQLTAVLRRDVSIAVEIMRFKPYFVTGQVAQSGATEWRPGLTLIQAIALAGGTTVQSQAGGAEQALSREQTRSHLLFSIVRRARLIAEKEGRQEVSFAHVSEELAKLGVPVNIRPARRLLDQQNDALRTRTAHFDSRIAALKRSKEIADSELRTLLGQQTEINGHVVELTRLTEIMGNLRKSNLVPNATYLARQTQLLQTRIRMSELASLIERARLTMTTIDGNITAAIQERQATLDVALEAVDREIAQLTLANNAAVPGQPQVSASELIYHIARKSESETQTIKATLFTEVLPGDVVVVAVAPRQQAQVSTDRLSSLDRMQAIMGAVAVSSSASTDRLLRNLTAR